MSKEKFKAYATRHVFVIMKLLYMLIFLGAFQILKIIYDYRYALGVAFYTYNFKNMIESLIYSVIIFWLGLKVVLKLL